MCAGTSYKIDPETGWPVLRDSNGGEFSLFAELIANFGSVRMISSSAPLYDFLKPPTPVIEEPASPPRSPSPLRPAQGASVVVSPPRSPLAHTTSSSSLPVDNESQSSTLKAEPRTATESVVPLRDTQESTSPSRSGPEVPSSPSYPPLDPNRPPSPTMNTKAANAMIDDLFAKTLDFTRFNPRSEQRNDDSDSQSGEPSTDESDDDENGFQGGLDFGGSQFSTQQATQASEVSSDGGFVPFSQTRSMMGDDSSFFGSQDPGFGGASSQHHQQQHPSSAYGRGLFALNEENENDENATPPAAPMQLFRDSSSAAPSSGGFRPVTKSTRAPLGAKPMGLSTPAPPQPQSGFSVFQDQGDSRIPSSQQSENEGTLDNVYEEEPEDYEAPLRDAESPDRADRSDGYAMGRRERGVPSRYAPFVDNMTPITERTLEITAAMNTNALSASQRSRRSSAFGNPAPVMEDDEPSTEEEDDDEEGGAIGEGDRAFVASYTGENVEETHEGNEDSSEDGSTSDSSSDSDDDLQPPTPHQQQQQPLNLLPPALVVLPDHTPVSASSFQFDESSIARLSIGRDQPSFDVSPNTSLPEGFTILGNQSGMTTGMVVADSTSTNRLSEVTPLNPYDRDMLRSHLSQLSTPIHRHSNVVDLSSRTADKLVGLQKTAKKRANSKAKDRTGVFDEAWDLELDGGVFSVREKLGEGSFGAVFRIAFPTDEEDADASFDIDGTELFLAVKVEKPTNFWEFHVLDQLQARLPERSTASIISPHRLYAYSDESYLLLDLCDRGSLLDAVNKAQEFRIAPPGPTGSGVDELLAMFFVIELLRTLETFHSSGFIHGDLKIDNCLLRFEEVEGSWQSTYDPTGANGWGQKGLKVIDYGRTIDTTIFRPGQQFVCDFKTDQFDCPEMRAGQPWTFQPDYYGVASIAYCALFGHYMETESVEVEVEGGIKKSKRVIKQAFRRYQQVELWTKLFDMLLNPRDVRSNGSLPVTNELASVRVEMEEWLVANCNKNGKSLKSLLSKL